MSNGEQRPQSRPQASPGGVSQDKIDAEMPPPGTARSVTEAKPAWLDQFVWSVLWKFVAVLPRHRAAVAARLGSCGSCCGCSW